MYICIYIYTSLEISTGNWKMSSLKTITSDVKSSYAFSKYFFLFKNHDFLFNDMMHCIYYYVMLFVIIYHVPVHVLYSFSYPLCCFFKQC